MMLTNREVYKRVIALQDAPETHPLPALEAYLRALWSVVSRTPTVEPTIHFFLEWIEKAFSVVPPPYDSAWENRTISADDCYTHADFDDWQDVILYQIVDLRQMAEAGILDDKYRYFGVNAPRGGRWYNFDPLTYLECGVRGTLGGYKEEEVVVLDPPSRDESADSPLFQILEFTWGDFVAVLECGRLYE